MNRAMHIAYYKLVDVTCRRDHPLPDIAPRRGDGVMRWPNGDVWIPFSTPPQRSGLFGRHTRLDWERHALAAAAQVLALARLTQRTEQD